MKKIALLLIATLVIVLSDSCNKYVTKTLTVTKTDTLAGENILIPIEIPCAFHLDTSFVFKGFGTVLLKLDSTNVGVKFDPIVTTTTTSEEKIPASTYRAMIRQMEQTNRVFIRQTEKSFRDSMDNIRKMYGDSLYTERRALKDSLAAWKKVSVVQARQHAREVVATSKGGFWARVKNSLFWFIIGLICGYCVDLSTGGFLTKTVKSLVSKLKNGKSESA